MASVDTSVYPAAVGLTVIQRSAVNSSDQGNSKDIVLPRAAGDLDSTRCELADDIAGSQVDGAAFSPGFLFGRYQIHSRLGTGGMGEIYRAVDTRLRRPVAIKVLASHSALDPDRVERLDREACAASALSHPNVVTVYEVGESNSIPYIATELVEGQTLRDLLAEGALPTSQLLDIAVQLADGLAAAHEAGIIHRDLTPANVMVSREGVVKLLDFGLAIFAAPGPGDGDDDGEAVTFDGSEMRVGEIAGTVGYMSPEQTRGLEIDDRSDQFAFGAILYELATGRRAFARANRIDALCFVLTGEPEPVDRVQAGVPPLLRSIIERCLAKSPEQRYRSTRELVRELRELRCSLGENLKKAKPPAATPSVGAVLMALVAAAASCLLLLGGGRVQARH